MGRAADLLCSCYIVVFCLRDGEGGAESIFVSFWLFGMVSFLVMVVGFFVFLFD